VKSVWFLALCLPALAFGQAKEKKFEGDAKAKQGVDWGEQMIRATGAGAPDLKASNPAQARLGAEKAAMLDAFRNLLAQVKGVQIDATKKMSDLMTDDRIAARVEGLIRNYRVMGKRYYSDGGVEVDVAVALSYLTDAFDPDPAQIAVPKLDGEKTNTGLVVDARGLKVVPALAPRLLDDAGKPVYSVDSLTPDARKGSGVAAYVQSLDDAKKNVKVGDKPLVIKATKAAGSDLALASEDAKRLREMNAGFLAEGKVVIVAN